MENTIYKNLIVKGQYLIVFVVAAFLIASCAGNSKTPTYAYSENGIKLCKNAIKLYNDLNNNEAKQGYYQEFIKILNNPSPETYIMKTVAEDKPSALKYLYINNALVSLEKAYTAYNLQLDPKISASSANLNEKLLMACNALDSIGISDALKTKNISIKKNIGMGKFKTEGSLFQIADIYAEVWNEIGQKQIAEQINFQKDYENGIKSIPVSAFNSEKIKTIIDEPYSSSAVLVNLYKLKLIKDNQEKLSKLSARINNISESFNLLVQIQGELMKRRQNKLRIQEMSNSLEVLLTSE